MYLNHVAMNSLKRSNNVRLGSEEIYERYWMCRWLLKNDPRYHADQPLGLHSGNGKDEIDLLVDYHTAIVFFCDPPSFQRAWCEGEMNPVL